MVAPAGTGKSRLLREFVARSGRSLDCGRCLSVRRGPDLLAPRSDRPGSGRHLYDDPPPQPSEAPAPSGPDAAAMSPTGSLARSVCRSAAYALEETFWAIRRYFSCSVAGHPLLVLIDDIHWAEPTFLELIRSLAMDRLRCAARPRVLCPARALRRASGLGRTIEHHRLLTLHPLSDDESAQIAANLLGASNLDQEVRKRIVTRSRATPSSSNRCSRCFWTTGSWAGRERALDSDPRRRGDHRPADDPDAPVGTPGPPRRDGAGGRRARGGDRSGVLPGSGRGPLPGRGPTARGRELREPHPTRADRAAGIDVRQPGDAPIRSSPDPRGRLPRSPEADPRQPPRPVHRLA